MDNPIELQSQSGALCAEVDLNGGMLARLQLKRVGKRAMDLLHRAPWLEDDYFNNEPGLFAHLSGEWVCAPFGWVPKDSKLFSAIYAHGLPCHSAWQVDSVSESKVVLSYVFPNGHPLKNLKRVIELKDDRVDLSFTLISNEDCAVPLGVHPCFPTDHELNALELEIAGDGIVYGIDCEPGTSRLVPAKVFESLNKLPLKSEYIGKDGNQDTVDATKLPFVYHTEEIVQMLHPEGQAVLNYKNKGLRLILKWDGSKIPTCLLWMSNHGRKSEPWNGENCCLGIEPIASCWDFGEESLKDSNPIKDRGVKTAVSIKAGVPFTFDYSIAIEVLD